MVEIVIDPEFRDLLPPLSADERQKLTIGINADGCREPLVVWAEESVLIDGHNRYAICNDLNLPFEVVTKSFQTRDEVKMWMCRNQLGRRNLTDFQRAEIALLMKPVLESQAKERQARKPADSVVENLPQQNEPRTRDVVGEIAGVSGKTIDKVEEILEKGSPELVEKARTKEVSIEKAYRIVTGKLPNTTEKIAVEHPAVTERQEQGWLAMKEEIFGRVRDYCRRCPGARGNVIGDIRKLLKSLER